jgi:hypothetical protein
VAQKAQKGNGPTSPLSLVDLFATLVPHCGCTNMKRALRILAAALAVAAAALWIATGANRGWTKTSEVVKTVDEVTGIEGISYRKCFIPGLDFLGGALLGVGILAGASVFLRNKP